MKYWHSAFDQARRRSFDSLLGGLPLGVVRPFNFSAFVDLEAFLGDTVDPQAAPISNVVISLPGREQTYIDNACVATAKFIHLIDCVRSDFQRGALTWSVVETHHAALFGIRCLAALFGLTIHRVHGRTMLVDVWPEYGTVDYQGKFQKRHRSTTDPVRLMIPEEDKLLEQKHTWTLLHRVLNIAHAETKTEADLLQEVQTFAEIVESKVRNEVMYYSCLWPDYNDLNLARIRRPDKVTWLADPVRSDPELLDLVDRLFAICRWYTVRLLAHIGGSNNDVHFLLNLTVTRQVYAA